MVTPRVHPGPGAVPGAHGTSYSFPSAHSLAVTAVLFACLGALALAYRWWWPWILALVVSVYVASTRLNLGVDWFSDVTCGLLLGIAWGVVVAVVAYWVEWDDLKAWLPGASGRRLPARGAPRW